MKITPLLLCFLLVKATVLSCGASAGCSSMEQEENMVVIMDCDIQDQSSDDNDKDDCCGDTCECMCCATPIMDVVQMTSDLGSPEDFTEANFVLIDVTQYDFHLRILQPPRLS